MERHIDIESKKFHLTGKPGGFIVRNKETDISEFVTPEDISSVDVTLPCPGGMRLTISALAAMHEIQFDREMQIAMARAIRRHAGTS